VRHDDMLRVVIGWAPAGVWSIALSTAAHSRAGAGRGRVLGSLFVADRSRPTRRRPPALR
jgi:hypothetical protein